MRISERIIDAVHNYQLDTTRHPDTLRITHEEYVELMHDTEPRLTPAEGPPDEFFGMKIEISDRVSSFSVGEREHQ